MPSKFIYIVKVPKKGGTQTKKKVQDENVVMGKTLLRLEKQFEKEQKAKGIVW